MPIIEHRSRISTRRFKAAFAGTIAVLLSSTAQAQATPSYPLLDAAASKLVQKYNSATCADLAKERATPASAQNEAMKDRAGDALRNDPAMRAHFVNQVAPTIVNKMIVCGFIP